jgi:hypothetical protein
MVPDGVRYSRVTHNMGDLSRLMYLDDFKTDTAHAMGVAVVKRPDVSRGRWRVTAEAPHVAALNRAFRI